MYGNQRRGAALLVTAADECLATEPPCGVQRLSDKSGLANARLSAEHNQPAPARYGFVDAVEQLRTLRISSDQRGTGVAGQIDGGQRRGRCGRFRKSAGKTPEIRSNVGK